jgi:hypothetical protein
LHVLRRYCKRWRLEGYFDNPLTNVLKVVGNRLYNVFKGVSGLPIPSDKVLQGYGELYVNSSCLSESYIPSGAGDTEVIVPDKRSRILEVVVVRRLFNLGAGNLEWGGNGKGLRKGRSVYE